MARNSEIEHLLRRAGFGASAEELGVYGELSVSEAIARLVEFDDILDTVDDKIAKPGYVGITTRGQFMPWANIIDARQRWLFRMLHSERPLQEKMTLFWHNHFATGYNKIAGAIGPIEATRYMAARSTDPGRVRGQIEMLRENALGNFRDILLAMAKDTAMLYWLDGRTNTKAKPQENFAREVMELFTMGVGRFIESDVYAGARVFTGWNVARVGANGDPAQHVEFAYYPNLHDTNAKEFSFPIYPGGSKTIPARSAADGLQDGIDFINGIASNPNTARYLAGKLYRFFVSEVRPPEPAFIDRIASVYFRTHYNMREVVREVLMSVQFWDSRSYFARYAWPVEFVVRAMKDVGWTGFSVGDVLAPLSAMGQILFEPPDVAGWDLGRSWFSTGPMLARMNYAAQLAFNQKFNLARSAKQFAATPESLLSYYLDALATPELDATVTGELGNYLRATGPWTGSDAQLQAKAPGLVHLIAGLPEYQFV